MHFYSKLPRLLVLIAVVCAAGYAGARMRACRVVGVAPVALTPAALPATGVPAGAQDNPVLVYPDAQVRERLKLGYKLYTQDAKGRMAVLPLPPGAALQTTLVLPSSSHKFLVFRLANDKCASPVAYKVSRFDRAKLLGQGRLSPQSRQQAVDSAGAQASLLVVQVRMAEGAQNNWFCNISLSWSDDA